MAPERIPAAKFGKTGREVPIVGLGGEGVLRTFGRQEEAKDVILEALQQGIRYFDSARVYSGSEGYYGAVWPEKTELRDQIFQTSKSARRDRKGALEELERTLLTIGLDHLDLWQIHDVRTEEDLQSIAGPKGALEAFVMAKKQGKVRWIGVTGHHDPAILTRAVEEWPVDSVMMPVNPMERTLGGFLDSTLPVARQKGIAVIGMKVLGAGHAILPELKTPARTLIRFALSQNITLAIVGCSKPAHVQTLAAVGRNFCPLSLEDQDVLIERFRPHARPLAYYRGV